MAKCTLNPNEISGAGDQPMSRRKSFKKSLRESFRRLRKGRSQRPMTSAPRANSAASPSADAGGPGAPSSSSGGGGGPTTAAEVRPVERQIEARVVDDGMGSMVRCLLMAKTYVVSQSQSTTPTLWAGTNSGAIYVFNLMIPAGMTMTINIYSQCSSRLIEAAQSRPWALQIFMFRIGIWLIHWT